MEGTAIRCVESGDRARSIVWSQRNSHRPTAPCALAPPTFDKFQKADGGPPRSRAAESRCGTRSGVRARTTHRVHARRGCVATREAPCALAPPAAFTLRRVALRPGPRSTVRARRSTDAEVRRGAPRSSLR